MKKRLAVVDDELIVCRRLSRALSKEGYEVETFQAAEPFLERMARKSFEVIFLDLRLPDTDGMAVLSQIKKNWQNSEVIIITGYGSIDSAIEAIKKGAYHYVAKPLKLNEVRLLAAGAVEKVRLKEEVARLQRSLDEERRSFSGLVGNSKVMQEIFNLIKKVAVVDCNVLLQGETGTGKELVARAIHNLSPRSSHPFVSFNCGSFTEELIANELFGHEKGAFTGAVATKIGLLETSHRGTVFLDEIGEMSFAMQVKLLRVIQEKKILRVGGTRPIDLDIRVIAASNKDLKELVEQGEFREDLYYRLNVVSIVLPRLEERKEDIPLLIAHFINKYSEGLRKQIRHVSPEAMEILLSYGYPGNVRELENIIERAVALAEGDVVRVEDLPPDLQKLEFLSLKGEDLLPLAEIEKRHIAKVLERTGWNRSLTCEILNLPRTTLWRKMKKYGLAEE
ncbi:MAG: sigma-54-dependent Fis family transcriptional regulator [Deltaproteobacteria bacterium]|nr:sigma-54-dependent Fis family transcriptional regulator [Deltaproteobacteria bacterium]MBW2071339.1 sigma-54-dependent Fis family transcriptional regulator [Deltaproteobacteria bacterium]